MIEAGPYRLDRHGVAGVDAVAHARQVAIIHAIRISGIAGAVWPNSSDAYIRRFSNELISEMLAFSIHVRRILEISEVRDVRLQGRLFDAEHGDHDCEYEEDLWRAINKIIHARSIEVRSFETPPNRFTRLGDRHIAYARVQSDRGEAVAICPTAMVYAYLGAKIDVEGE